MSSLNSRLQLALLNRKKGRNLLEKGFTLVELMIVIVIVGVLSAVALPNFLSQTQKAKITECKSQLSAQLKQVAAEYVNTGTTADAIAAVVNVNNGAVAQSTAVVTAPTTIDLLSNSSNAGIFFYTTLSPQPDDEAIVITCQAWQTPGTAGAVNALSTSYPEATAADDLKAGGLFGCVNLTNGKVRISGELKASGDDIENDPDVSNGNSTTAGDEVCGTKLFTSASLL